MSFSCFDYCNSLLSGTCRQGPDQTLMCPILTDQHCDEAPQFIQSVPLLRSLQWLPVKFRLSFQIHLLMYKTLREKQPVYQQTTSYITPIPLIEITKGNPAVSFQGKEKSRIKGISFLHLFSMEQASAIGPFPHSTATSKKCLKWHLFDMACPL